MEFGELPVGEHMEVLGWCCAQRWHGSSTPLPHVLSYGRLHLAAQMKMSIGQYILCNILYNKQ